MGTTAGSILQGIGQTGNEIGSGDIAAQNQSHQFLMDYLARQNQARELNLQQSGQEQTGRIAAGQQSLEQQRINQGRWTVMPGYSKIPSPDDPTKSLFRTTLLDPITKQQTYYDTDQPPVGSPEYIMKGYKYADDFAKQAGITLTPSQKLAFGGLKADTVSDNNQKYASLYDMMAADPDGKAYLDANYKGGRAQFIDEHVKNSEIGYSREDQLKMIRDFVSQGKTSTGQNQIPQMDKIYEDSLTKSLTAYQKMFDDASKNISTMGVTGKYFQPEAYAAAVSARDLALNNLNDVKGKLSDLRSRTSTPPEPGPTVTPPAFTNPTVGMSHNDAAKIGAKLVDVNGVTHLAMPDGTDLGIANGTYNGKNYVNGIVNGQ